MKKNTILTIILFGVILLVNSGCGEKILVNGKYYNTMTESEFNEMLAFARLTLTSPSNKLQEPAKEFINKTMPNIIINYEGDKTGWVSYEWIYNDHQVYKIICHGKFLTDLMVVKTRAYKIDDPIDEKTGITNGTVSFKPFDYQE